MTYKQERFMSILHRTSELARKKKPSLMGERMNSPHTNPMITKRIVKL